MAAEEMLELCDEQGNPTGVAPRRLCHGNPALRHRVVHILVHDGRGNLWLQRRSPLKDLEPGKWDTSAAGHFMPGETPEAAAARELFEELGIRGELRPLPRFEVRTPVETEVVFRFRLEHHGPFVPEPAEIAELRLWTPAEIMAGLLRGEFTPGFAREWQAWHAGLEPRYCG